MGGVGGASREPACKPANHPATSPAAPAQNHDEYHRKRWHASVAAAQSPDVFKALITSLEGGFERGSTTLMWQACLRVQWARFDPLDVPPGTEPGSPLVLRRLATWLLGLPAAFSTPYYVLEWDFEDRPVWRHALLNLVGAFSRQAA